MRYTLSPCLAARGPLLAALPLCARGRGVRVLGFSTTFLGLFVGAPALRAGGARRDAAALVAVRRCAIGSRGERPGKALRFAAVSHAQLAARCGRHVETVYSARAHESARPALLLFPPLR